MKKQRQKQKQKQKQSPSLWQDLNPFLLSKIFSFLDFNDQLFGAPFVCRSWLSSTVDTLFKNSSLDLRLIDTLEEENQRLRFTHLLKLALNQYHGWVSIYFPTKHLFGYFGTLYIAERTPSVSSVVLSSSGVCGDFAIFISLLYWKNLKVFRAPVGPENGFHLISQLADRCKKLKEIRLQGTIMEKEVSSIVEGFPGLQILDFSESTLSSNALDIVFDGRLKFVKEINILHSKVIDDEGKDIREDYWRLNEVRNRMLEKAAGIKSLKKLSHCLVKNCPDCKDSPNPEG
ncbi:hypothetical protein RHMOL_Rhmol06G0271000 [Rhododendron molle]|uniref:Uncharacterized protein n=1 Tax=Rhododendron molle TaxID=49168 RepID=A0ACC0NH26_RHOML|nr:hypothetical protein RHMOL_Rhmol06G0271000 [Rhododendron molle]